VRPLRDLVAELALVLARAGLDQARLERLRERALAVLRAFAAPAAPLPAPGQPRVPGQPREPGRPQVPGQPPAPARDPRFWTR
jgi:hypothetical protein